MAVPVGAIVKAGLLAKKYWKEIAIGAIAIIFFLISIPAIVLSVLFPSNNNQNVIDIYKKVSEETSISWIEMLIVDTVKNDNDLRNITYNSINNTALDFYSLEVKRYEKVTRTRKNAKGEDVSYTTWELRSINNYKGNSIRNFINSSGYNGNGSFSNIKSSISNIDSTEEYALNLSVRDFEDVIYSLPNDKQEWARELLSSDGIQQLYGDAGVGDIILSDIEYPPGGAKIPLFMQSDARWGNESYGSSTIRSGGCGPTSLAMVIVGLTGREDVNPKVVADWSVDNGHRAEGQGSYWSLMTSGGKHFGLTVQAISRNDPKRIVSELSKGNPIIASMDKGHFTSGGHFIVLRGVSESGKILVNDSASITRSNKEWDLSIIMNESSTNGGVKGSPFWVFKKR